MRLLIATVTATAWTLSGLSACQPSVPSATTGSAAIPADATDTAGGDTAPDSTNTPSPYPADDSPPTVTLTQPAPDATVAADITTIAVTGEAHDDVAVAALTVQVGLNVPKPVGLPASDGSFAFDVTLGAGPQPITVRAYDIRGNMGLATVTVSRDGLTDDAPPTLTVDKPLDGFSVATPTVVVAGTTTDDAGVTRVEVTSGATEPVVAASDDHFATWTHEAPLVPGPDGLCTLTVTAFDAAGHSAEVVLVGTTTSVVDQQPPQIAFTAPPDGLQTDADQIAVSGTASDPDSGVASVEVRVDDGPYAPAQTDDDFATWTATVDLPPGEHTIKARAVDSAGLQASASVTVTNTSGDVWGAPKQLTLNWAPPDYAAQTFTLDKAGLLEMMPPGAAGELVMLELDVRPLVAASVAAIKSACGPGWQTKDVTAGCPSSWGQPEINTYRLVTMTPANVNVVGTSIEGMEEIASVLSTFGLLDDFDEILADALGIGLTDTIVSSQGVADAMVDNVMASHPNVLPGALMPVTMEDALTDMATLAPKFDATGDHPGFVDSVTGETYSKVLLDAFEMTMVATSNLHWHDGVDLATGKAYMAIVADETGPTDNDVLEFDFLSPDTFQVDGIAANPTVDLVFQMFENPQWIAVGDSRYPLPMGNGAAWNLDPWELEHVFVDAAFKDYENHRAGCDLCQGSDEGALLYEALGVDEAEIVVGRDGYDKDPLIGGPNGQAENFSFIDPNPAGWMRIWTLFGLGDPPAPQYVWDMILEVAEQRLLDGGVGQGQGNVRFPLTNIPVGVTGDQIKEATRPILESQKSKLSDLLLGDYNETAQALDFYLAKGADEALYLFFVHPSDPVPSGTAAHEKPGFFADEALTDKVSSADPGDSGDAIHQKVKVGDAEQTVYCQDVSGTVYRVKIGVAQGDSVTLVVRQRLQDTP